MTIRHLFWPAVAAILAIVGVLEVRSAMGETQTWDEGIHISAGYSYLKFGDYSWNVEHPPLVKMVSAPAADVDGAHGASRTGRTASGKTRCDTASISCTRTGAMPIRILIAARSANILLTLLFAAAVAWWTRRRYGPAAGLAAAALCAFDPNLIAHGRYVTTDFPVTAFFFFACVLWVEYLEQGTPRRLLAAAVAIGAGADHEVLRGAADSVAGDSLRGLLDPPAEGVSGAPRGARGGHGDRDRGTDGGGGLLAGDGALLAYQSAADVHLVVRGNPTGEMLYYLGRKLHLPAHAYLFGLNAVADHNAGGHSSYLLGMRSETGWWYYFPVVFAVKSTMAALAARWCCCSPRLCGRRGSGNGSRRWRWAWRCRRCSISSSA